MSPIKPVKSLSTMTITKVGENVCEYLVNHVSKCDAYQGIDIPEYICCQDLLRAKEQILLPSGVSRLLLDRVLDSWASKRKFFRRVRRQQINLLMHVFTTLQESFMCEFVARDHTDFNIIISPCGKNINALKLYYKDSIATEDSYILQFFWKRVLTHTPNLHSLDFAWDIVTDKMLGVIARSCPQLKELRRVKFDDTLLPTSFVKFCFKDFPNQTILNSCCHTMEVMEVYCSSSSLKIKQMLFDGCCLLMNLLPNLRSLGSFFFIEELLRHAKRNRKQLFPTRIEEFCCCRLSESQAYQLRKVYSKVKKIYIENPSVEVLDSTRHFPLLTHLSITYYEETDNLFYATPFENLLHLELLNVTDSINLTVLQSLCPKLIYLDLHCHSIGQSEITWTPRDWKPFKDLQRVRMALNAETRSYDWVKIFSNTVKMLDISFGRVVDEFDIFLSTPFPVLEKMVLSHAMSMSVRGILNVIFHCPNLRAFGKFHFQLKDLQTVLNMANMDITLLTD